MAVDIKTRVRQLKNIIKDSHDELSDHQEFCTHSDVTKQSGGSTGNYDPSADCYWVDYHCNICDKRWTEYK